MKRWRAWLFAELVVVLLIGVVLSSCLRLGPSSSVPQPAQVDREHGLNPSPPSLLYAAPARRSANWEASRPRAAPAESYAPLSNSSIQIGLLRADDTGPPWLDSRGPPGSDDVGPAVKVVRLPVPPAANQRGGLHS
jgi:hypothetical protein